MVKLKVAILGSGNIGTDLMYKIERSAYLTMSVMVGIDSTSEGIRRAKDRGYHTITNGISGLVACPELFDIVFDATTANAHTLHSEQVLALGKKIVDLTPAAIGPFVVPCANLEKYMDVDNVNMVTCGGKQRFRLSMPLTKWRMSLMQKLLLQLQVKVQDLAHGLILMNLHGQQQGQ